MLRWPRLILIVTGLLLVLSLVNLTKIKTLYAVHDIADPTLSYAQAFRETRDDFNLGSSMMVSFKPDFAANFTTEKISKIRSWASAQDYNNPNLLSLGSPFDIRRPKLTDDLLWYFRLIDHNFPEEIEALKNTPWRGILTGLKTQDLSVILTFKGGIDSQFFGSFDPRPVGKVLGDLAEKFKNNGSYFVAGEAVFQYFCHEGISRNNELNLYLLGFLLLAFRVLFGTWRSGLAFVLTISIMAIITFGTMALFQIPIDLISSGLFLMLAVAALEDFLFFCSEQLTRQTHWKKAMRTLLIPSFFTSFTTIIGFGSLAATHMLIMKRFGTWAAFGSFIEWICCFFILPALMIQFSYFRNLTNIKKSYRPNLPDVLLKMKLNRPLARSLLVIFVTGFFALFHLNISGAPKDMMSPSHPFIQGIEDLKLSRGWEGIVQIIFDKDHVENLAVLEKLAKLDNVAQVFGAKILEKFFVENLKEPEKNIALRDLQDTDFYKSFFSKKQKSRVELYVRDTETQPMMKLLGEIELVCGKKCTATSESAAHAEFSARIPEAFIESFATSLASVCLILLVLVALLTKKPRPYFSILLSSMWGPFLIMSLFWILDTKINFMACLFMTVLIGLAGDNAIQFLFASKKIDLTEGLSRRGHGSMTISFLIAGSCLVFLGSYFVSPRVYGLFLGLGILVSTFGDIWLLKALRNDSCTKP